MKVSIVIPVHDNWLLTHQLLFDLYACSRAIAEVIVVNDASEELESYSGLDWWKNSKMLPIREIRLKENRGFLKASNVGLKKSTGDITVLCSNDVRITSDIVHSAIISMIGDRILAGGRLLDFDTGWNTFNGKIFPYLEGWLLVAKTPDWAELGYFDERFAPNDYEDIDLSTTAIDKGYTLRVLADAKISHAGAQSIGYSAVREELTRKNREVFKEKWIMKK